MSKKKSSYPSFWPVFLTVMGILVLNCTLKYIGGLSVQNSAEKAINDYAQAHGYKRSDYPDELVKLLESNDETEDFVLNYPKKKSGSSSENINMSQYKGCTQPPLLMQWDERWGYSSYNGSIMGLSGSAPTCLSMTAIYELQNVSVSPIYTANIAIQNDWENKPEKLLSEGARSIGLEVTQIPINESRLKQAVEGGSTVICITDGKVINSVIVIYGMDENGKYKINDPMSRSNSERTYTYSEMGKYFKKMWGYNASTE